MCMGISTIILWGFWESEQQKKTHIVKAVFLPPYAAPDLGCEAAIERKMMQLPDLLRAAGCVLSEDAQSANTAPERQGGLEVVAEPPFVSTSLVFL